MDFNELEAMEGLRWSWHTWPSTKPEVASLVIPLSIMCTPLTPFDELPILPYEPLNCSNNCHAVLNPYSRVDYTAKIWICPFCHGKNRFPESYIHINENNIPAELFPTYCTVEYHLNKRGLDQGLGGLNSGIISSPRMNGGLGLRSNSSSFGSMSAYVGGSSGSDRAGAGLGMGPAFVFVVDASTPEDELGMLKSELLHVINRLPENALVGLVVFDSMVRVYDLGFTECFKVVLFHGERDVSSEQVLMDSRI